MEQHFDADDKRGDDKQEHATQELSETALMQDLPHPHTITEQEDKADYFCNPYRSLDGKEAKRRQQEHQRGRLRADQHGPNIMPDLPHLVAYHTTLLRQHHSDRFSIRVDQRYVELVVRVTEPVVGELAATFITDWFSETSELIGRETSETLPPFEATGDSLCQVLPSGSGYDNDNNLKLFTALIHAAQRTVTITNPYFVPDDSLMTAITSAAQRGVDVTFITSEMGDQFFVFHAQHSYYEELLLAGVKIYQYASPIILHAKHMTIDDDIAVIGSSNLDMRSLTLNLEVTLVAYDPAVVAALRPIQDDYLAHSTPVQVDAWHNRPLLDKLSDNITRLTATLQ